MHLTQIRHRPQLWDQRRHHTGLLKETRALSTKVNRRTPHPSSVRATEQPRVPAPSRRQRWEEREPTSRLGTARQRISLRFRSTAVLEGEGGVVERTGAQSSNPSTGLSCVAGDLCTDAQENAEGVGATWLKVPISRQ
ncbi:hypothetical protein F751_0605 [Auxenochlorella protothecoides]|uniref:Uncharacterized protein n=1 Tax=Auxenochlorella protothecoides TaxID=3075 RepID=A0A087SIM4_AUXPR|nr:hypothetical protein F751_0605 [Auxenochlorella protothecoides]KFM25578.1 hypothetical protein F751_0605 [Auxenochlorella protothecoides]